LSLLNQNSRSGPVAPATGDRVHTISNLYAILFILANVCGVIGRTGEYNTSCATV